MLDVLVLARSLALGLGLRMKLICKRWRCWVGNREMGEEERDTGGEKPQDISDGARLRVLMRRAPQGRSRTNSKGTRIKRVAKAKPQSPSAIAPTRTSHIPFPDVLCTARQS